MSHSVRRHLSGAIDAYDETIRTFIPGYEAMVKATAEVVLSGEPDRVLDLGAGTGALSRAVLSRSPMCVVEILDVDLEMLDRARERLAGFGPRARFREGSFDDPLPPCGAAMACLALHHVPTLDSSGRPTRTPTSPSARRWQP